MTTAFLILLALGAAAYFVYAKRRTSAGAVRGRPGNPRAASTWSIQYSIGVPERPAPHPDGWVIELPQPTAEVGSVHYVTMPTDPIADGTVRMRYRVEADPGVRIVPRNFPDSPSVLTLYFQREGDVLAGGAFEAYRWFASFASQMPIEPGEHVIEARFADNWTAVLSSSRATNPAGYQEALANAVRVGFVLGGGDGLGHGVYATGPARIVVTSFEVLQ